MSNKEHLTVLTQALVTRLTLNGKRVTGVEIVHHGAIRRTGTGSEVILSLGAIHTLELLMQSGIGDQDELHGMGIPVVDHLLVSGDCSEMGAQKTFDLRGSKEKELIWIENTTRRFKDGYNYFGRYPEKILAFLDKHMT